jgi:DnaJ-class molecular chaperone
MESNKGKSAMPSKICPKCNGTGKTEITSGKFADRMTSCEECGGIGVIITSQGPSPAPPQEKPETST